VAVVGKVHQVALLVLVVLVVAVLVVRVQVELAALQTQVAVAVVLTQEVVHQQAEAVLEVCVALLPQQVTVGH